MVKWIIIAILLLPLAEILAFILVAALIGMGWAFLLMLATTLAGFVVLRRAGRGRIARFRVAVADTDVAGIQGQHLGIPHRAGRPTAVPAGLPHRPGRRGAADRAGAPLVRQVLSAVGTAAQSSRPLHHRPRTGRMGAIARPRPSAQQARPALTRVCRVLVCGGMPC